jgi:hypothetical protein
MEDLLYESDPVRRVVGLKLSDPLPDETTILNFRDLLERHQQCPGPPGQRQLPGTSISTSCADRRRPRRRWLTKLPQLESSKITRLSRWPNVRENAGLITLEIDRLKTYAVLP